LQIVATISDFVGAPPFFAIFKFLVRKNAAENIFRGELFGAQHITQVRIRKHFRCTGMRQMPCFLGPRAHAATRGESQRAKNPRACCTNLRHHEAAVARSRRRRDVATVT
jgi:hypothetical protein